MPTSYDEDNRELRYDDVQVTLRSKPLGLAPLRGRRPPSDDAERVNMSHPCGGANRCASNGAVT